METRTASARPTAEIPGPTGDFLPTVAPAHGGKTAHSGRSSTRRNPSAPLRPRPRRPARDRRRHRPGRLFKTPRPLGGSHPPESLALPLHPQSRPQPHPRPQTRDAPWTTVASGQSTSPDPEQALGKLEAIGTLQLLIAELHEDDRALISLKYHDGLKYDQISQRTGLSVGNVGYKLHHALKNLADSLRRLGVESAEG